MGTDGAFRKAEPNIEKALDPVLVSKRGTTNLFEFVKRRYFEILGLSSQPDMQVGCLLGFGQLLCIFKN